MDFTNIKIGFCVTGSFCTISKAIEQMKLLKDAGAEIYPVFSNNAYSFDTRFALAEEINKKVKDISGKKIIHSIVKAEEIGPKIQPDVTIVAPCTGNTLAKLINGVTDTPAVLAAKAHLRNDRPLVLAIATNDALSNNMENISKAITRKNIYVVPFKQDDPVNKKTSMVCDFSQIGQTIRSALDGKQLQPIFK